MQQDCVSWNVSFPRGLGILTDTYLDFILVPTGLKPCDVMCQLLTGLVVEITVKSGCFSSLYD